MLSHESVISRAFAIQTRRCQTRKTLGLQVLKRNCRNEEQGSIRYGRGTNSTRDDPRSGAAHARPACAAPAQLQLVDRTDLRSGGTTRTALVVGGLRHHLSIATFG